MLGVRQGNMRRRRSRMRRALKWAGLLVCTGLVCMFLASIRWRVCYVRRTWVVFLQYGALACDYWGHLPPVEQEEHSSFWQPTGWAAYPEGNSFRRYWFGLWLWPDFQRGVPLWMPFIALVIPTALLWWRDHRLPEGHCQSCGYDLTGNTSGVCPECGERM